MLNGWSSLLLTKICKLNDNEQKIHNLKKRKLVLLFKLNIIFKKLNENSFLIVVVSWASLY